MGIRKLVVILALSAPALAQVQVAATIGAGSGYRPPYVEVSLEGAQEFQHIDVRGEVRGAMAHKSDTGDGWHLGTRAIAALELGRGFEAGGGFSYSKQWTSLYEKDASRPLLYLAWHDAQQRIEGVGIFRGSDVRNGQQGGEGRYTARVNRRLSWRGTFQLLRGYQTDRPKEPLWIGTVYGSLLICGWRCE